MEELKELETGVNQELLDIDFDALNFDDIQELEEIVTPGNGSICCC